MAQIRRSGVSLSVMDGFFAATALTNELTPVTRNLRDFKSFCVPLFNPWDE
jgi:toxin FitB